MQALWKATKMDYFFLKNEVIWKEFQDGILLNSYVLIEKNFLQYTLYDSKRDAYVLLSNQNASISFDRYGVYSLVQNGTWLSGNFLIKSIKNFAVLNRKILKNLRIRC